MARIKGGMNAKKKHNSSLRVIEELDLSSTELLSSL